MGARSFRRRLENMISSALKFGTTKHWWLHEGREEGGPLVPAIKWKDGDGAFNLAQMIKVSYSAVVRLFPEIRDLRYNPETDAF
ncbi:hypothetical protein [Teredinibacter turnerae]|uniref:hypothetical protein n=1 Tax=Teredinibacter turnerae TaxID=2426 RepID=UPI0022A83A2D|nr:hypothetical protein [Teredinibacter turnerae]